MNTQQTEQRKLLFLLFGVILAVILILELFVEKHPAFKVEYWFGFNALYGFLAAAVLMFGGRYILRPLVKRKEDFYND